MSPPEASGRSDLRQRLRTQILRDKKEEERAKNVIQKSIIGSQRSSHMLKTFLVVITALLCTVGALIRQFNPKLVQRLWPKPIPTFQLATRYPANMVLDRDLPRFFRHLTIATPENQMAREAVRKMLQSRNQLRRRAGRIKTIVKAWDDMNVEQLLNQRFCGEDFEAAYRISSQQRKDDLLMWCLVASRISEGFFKESVDMIDSPLFLTRKRGIMVKRQPPEGIADGYGALSTSFYLHPRNNKSTAINSMPSQILSMLVSTPEEEIDGDGQEEIERMLYELVVAQGNEDEFLILEEICQQTRPERSIAFEASKNGEGCFFVVPKRYGGNFNPDDED